MLGQDTLFYWKGPQTTLMIERFKQVCPVKYVQTCSSGTAALHIAVAAAGIGPGDEVITSPITDIGTVIGVIYQQGVPVFADLGASTYNLDLADVERRITPKTKAIIAVHLVGNPCDLDALKAIADKHKLVLIEDCAQAWGAKYRGQPIGTIGHHRLLLAAELQARHLRRRRRWLARTTSALVRCCKGSATRESIASKAAVFESFATNYRMSEPQAAVVAGPTGAARRNRSQRARLGNLLTEKITGIARRPTARVSIPKIAAVYWFYFFRIRPEAFRCDRAEFVKALAAEGVAASAGYIPVPLYRKPVFQKHGFFAGRWPVRNSA